MPIRIIDSRILSALFWALIAGHSGLTGATTWENAAPLTQSRSEISAAVAGGKVLVAGGIGFFKTLATCEMFDPERDQWSSCPPLPQALHHLALASDGSTVFAAGGYRNLLFSHQVDPKLWAMNPEGKAWTAIANLPAPIGEHSLVHFSENLYLFGGRTEAGDSRQVWRYSLSRDTWTQMADMPNAKHSFSTVIVGQEIWLLGGRSRELGSAIRSIAIYSVDENAWRQGPLLPEGGAGLYAFECDGAVHVVGGEVFDPNRVLKQHVYFDREKQQWNNAVLSLVARHGGATAVIGDTALLIGGGTKPGLATVMSTSKEVQSFSCGGSDADE